MNISPETRKMLELSMLRGIGPASLRQISKIPSFVTEDAYSLLNRAFKGNKATDSLASWSEAVDLAGQQIENTSSLGGRILSVLDNDYPSLLRDTHDAPYFVHVLGKMHERPEYSVAVIGTREPTDHGIAIAERMTKFFVENNWSIVSGLALGCDGVAHRAALEAGGHTVAVLAHGLHTVAPKSHKKLAEDILAAGGALLSEYHYGVPPLGGNYVKRDRTQAGLARGVVMIQSDLKGGSLYASRAALEYGRWLAVPYPTNMDIDSGAAKIRANILLASGNKNDAMGLLRCSASDLERLYIVWDKRYYKELIENISCSMADASLGGHSQKDLL